MRFFRKKNLEFLFQGKWRFEILKRNSQVRQPEFKSSRKLKRGLSFNDLIILVLDVLYGNLED